MSLSGLLCVFLAPCSAAWRARREGGGMARGLQVVKQLVPGRKLVVAGHTVQVPLSLAKGSGGGGLRSLLRYRPTIT